MSNLKEKIQKTTLLSESQKIRLLSGFDKLTDKQKKKIEKILSKEEKLYEQAKMDVKTLARKTVKEATEEAETQKK